MVEINLVDQVLRLGDCDRPPLLEVGFRRSLVSEAANGIKEIGDNRADLRFPE